MISRLYIVSAEFWEVLDFIFATSFSNAIAQYFKRMDLNVITKSILENLVIATKSIKVIFPNTDFQQEDAIKVMTHIYLEFPTIIVREFGAQTGMISVMLGIEKQVTKPELPEEWFEKIREESLIEMNKKLKLLKEN